MFKYSFKSKNLVFLATGVILTMTHASFADDTTTDNTATGNSTSASVVADDSQQTDTKTEAIEFISFLDMLPAAVELDKSVAIAELSYQSSLETAKAAWSGWYPKADITLNSGEQYDVKPGGSNGGVTSPGMTGANGTGSSNQRYNPTEAKLKITQKLWDFGETSADIETSKLTAEMSRLSLHGAKNQTILKAAQAYIGLKKAHAQFKIAQDGEMQLKKQTGLQDFRVSRGAAVGTDVLQAKNALAGAITSRVTAEGGLKRALSQFEKVFGSIPANIDALLPIRIPNILIPESEDSFREAVMKNGDQLMKARVTYDMAVIASKKAMAANFLPEFKATAEVNYKGDASGTLGGKTEYIGKVEMSWPLELFGTQINTYRAAKLTGESAELTYGEAVRAAEESITNSWIQYNLAALNRANVQNQVTIAEQFLRLSQIEVQQGRGQMMMVMNAQNALINARKALQSNTSDHAVQVYNLLAQMGSLSLENLVSAAKEEDEMLKAAMDEYKKKVAEAVEAAKAKQEGESASADESGATSEGEENTGQNSE